METSEQINRIEYFLRNVMIKELSKVVELELSYMQFVIMGQAVEVLGSFLDTKPMKAKGQSAKRFASGVTKLFGGRYRLLNENYYLYDKLRNQMTHTFIPGGDLLLINRNENKNGYKHLEVTEGKLVLISEFFYEDICKAVDRLCEALKTGKIKPKNIGYQE
ncbi:MULTISPECIES: hypothetical protein [Porphyromonadaceae]|uniref:Cthe-2314-like HEPN domain-containing protein n=1 Tax=Sanguibacteroides justesenii TaxID=1547597 RepID=A0A0C3RI59_9PORP|nr:MULTISPECIES: hypothetical protein [Porphyromonadaceae]KIO43400.1 hypothetical protein IE90_09665 [Sanguibacteroides justesenii]KIO45579.1 hypothetical protein BA92_03700 [Sanguibacteroides justesenii]MCR9012407.1 hypothetical protein [Gabonibacter chumensis]PXZ45326.1 hypothetical protein DMB45_02580 [Sanguibacteroides justesenii]